MTPEQAEDARGLFGPGSMMWRINRERVVLLAGPAAAVLQAAHPQVAMGVAAHSSFRTDSVGRLQRTLDAVYSVAFGTMDEVGRIEQKVARSHQAVQGPGYSAFDPDAQLWVLATLIMGSVTMYRRFVGSLSTPELNRFLEENSRFGGVFGLAPARVPKSWNDFGHYFEGMLNGPLLGSIPACAEVANAVIHPEAPWFMRALSPVLRALAVEYLPPTLQERLRIRRGCVSGTLWASLDRILPALVPVCPAFVRFDRRYIAAHQRFGF